MLDTLARESALMNTIDDPRPMTKKTGQVITVSGDGLVQGVRKEEYVEEYSTNPEGSGYVPQVMRDSKHIPLMSLPSLKKNFSIPWYQREGAWKYEDKVRYLIFILHGIPSGAVMIDVHTVKGQRVDDILDGQQRYTTIQEFMAEGSTLRLPSPEQYTHFKGRKLPLLGATCSYKTLPLSLKTAFDNYSLEFVYVEKLPRAFVTPTFHEVNRQKKLSLGQSLWANETDTAELARYLSHYDTHPMWSVVFRHPPKNRPVESDKFHIRYQAALTAIAIELTPSPFTLPFKTDHLERFAAGERDSELLKDEEGTYLLQAPVLRQFDSITRVFYGADVNSRMDMLMMSQLIALMERGYGYDLRYAPQGYYTKWLHTLRKDRRQAADRSFSPVSFLAERIEQERFWEVQLPPLLARAEVDGLVKASQVDEAYLAELATSGM